MDSLSRPCILLGGMALGCGDDTEKFDGRYPGPLLGVNGVMGDAGAFIRRPPHRLQCDEPDGL